MKIVITNPVDLRVEILDVEDRMIEHGNVETFLRSHGYDKHTSWMAAPTWKVPVSLHEYRVGKDGQEEHATHELPLYRASLGALFYVIREMEIRELMAAVCKHGEVSDDGAHTVRFNGECKPTVAGYAPDGKPYDYVITRVSVSKDNRISIYGVKCESIEEVRVYVDDIFLSFIHDIVEEIESERRA